jgi:hypothetical protein
MREPVWNCPKRYGKVRLGTGTGGSGLKGFAVYRVTLRKGVWGRSVVERRASAPGSMGEAGRSPPATGVRGVGPGEERAEDVGEGGVDSLRVRSIEKKNELPDRKGRDE